MKYSFEDKLKAVKYYLEKGTYLYPDNLKTPSQKHTYLTQAKFWTSKYLAEGEDGLRHKENNDVYSPERKLAIIDPVMRMEISVTKQSRVTGINVGTLCAWIKRYKLLGIDGLKCSKRGRPPKNMPDIKETKKTEEPEIPVSNADGNVQQLLARIAQLEKDNAALKDRNKDLEHKDLLSQAENEYLKKLHALAETKRRLKTPTKPKSSVSSAKAADTKED